MQQPVQSVRALLYDLTTRLGLQGTTTIIASESDPRDAAMFPETTTADVIIGLYYELAGVRGRRGCEVVKMRGCASLPGRHGLSLDEAGAVVYPRLEARVADSPRRGPRSALGDGAPNRAASLPPGAEMPRATFGLPELDALLGGGLTLGASTLLTGSIGVGKTLLGLNLALEGVRRREPTLFLGFRETPDKLLQKADAFEIGADVVAHHLIAALDRTRARRLVIDSIAELEHAVVESSGADRVPNYMSALLAALRSRGVTLLALREAPKAVTQYLEISSDALSVVAENVLHLQVVTFRSEVRRVLTVVKMRFSAFDPTLREFRIAPPESFRVVGPAETGADVLLEIARQYGFTTSPGSGAPVTGSAG